MTMGSHWDTCWKDSSEHWECAVAMVERLEMLAKTYLEEVIVLRTVSKEQAKAEIKALFEEGETMYFSDIAQKLRLDLSIVVEICGELLEEEDIEVDTKNA